MTEYLIIGGVLFWVYVAVMAIGFLLAVCNEATVFGMVVAFLSALGFTCLFGVDFHGFPPRTWQSAVVMIAAYLPAGVLWSIYKFYVTYKDRLRELKAKRDSWEPGPIYKTWPAYVDAYAPKVRLMKGDICTWIMCWPVSVVIYLLSDVLRHIAEAVYEWFSGIYERIAANLRESIK